MKAHPLHLRPSQIWGCQQGHVCWVEAEPPGALCTGRPVQVTMGFVTSVCLGVGRQSANCHLSASSWQKVTPAVALELTEGLLVMGTQILLMGTQILLRSHLPGFPPSVKHEAHVNGLHQEDAASKDLLVTSLTGSSPGPFTSDQDQGTNSGQRGGLRAEDLMLLRFRSQKTRKSPLAAQRQQQP